MDKNLSAMVVAFKQHVTDLEDTPGIQKDTKARLDELCKALMQGLLNKIVSNVKLLAMDHNSEDEQKGLLKEIYQDMAEIKGFYQQLQFKAHEASFYCFCKY